MSKKFTEYSKFDLSNVNKEVLKKWKDGDIFHKSLETREGHPTFVFYEGPPSANGMPGIHHVIARSIKDIFCRYKTMKGFLVNRNGGLGYTRSACRVRRGECIWASRRKISVRRFLSLSITPLAVRT